MSNYLTLDLLPTFDAYRDLVVRFSIVVEAIYSLFVDTDEVALLFFQISSFTGTVAIEKRKQDA